MPLKFVSQESVYFVVGEGDCVVTVMAGGRFLYGRGGLGGAGFFFGRKLGLSPVNGDIVEDDSLGCNGSGRADALSSACSFFSSFHIVLVSSL